MNFPRIRAAMLSSRCLKRAGAAWFLSCCTALAFSGSFASPEAVTVPLWLWGAGTAAWFLALSFPCVLVPARACPDDHFLLGASLLYAMLLMRSYGGKAPYVFAAAVLTALFLLWFPLLRQRDFRLFPLSLGWRGVIAAAVGWGVLFVAVSGGVTCLRYANYRTPNFDFGLFCQMFHNMKETLLPMTTSERNGLLSHFAVHLSPIWYVLLPFYCLFPSPYTLQAGQAVILASGLIPLYLLCRKRGLSPKSMVLFCALYALYPALSTGGFYDIHENCFLTPLLLGLFACYEYRRFRLMFVAALAVLLVKEDAAVYLLFFALYLFFSEKQRRRALLLAAVGLLYFVLAILWLQWQGEGAMFGRYANLTGDSGLLSLPGTLLRNPGFFLTQLFHTDSGSGGKLLYLFQLLIPLGGLPLMAGRPGRLLLLAPLLLNLLTQYVYQYDTGFQYSFGITAFLFYAAVLNGAELSPRLRPRALLGAGAACLLLFQTAVIPTLRDQLAYACEHQEELRLLQQAVSTVPEGASVTASCMLVAPLSQREELYELKYHPSPDTDYLVLDLRPAYRSESLQEARPFREAGYETVGYWDGAAKILRAPWVPAS